MINKLQFLENERKIPNPNLINLLSLTILTKCEMKISLTKLFNFLVKK